MSSTNRGAVRVENDFYETPASCVRSLLSELGPICPSNIIEPCAGRGAVIQQMHEYWPLANIVAYEIDRERSIECIKRTGDCNNSDFFSNNERQPYDLCITNPPFGNAIPFVEKALTMCREVAMLLRIAMVSSESRAEFWKQHPADMLVLPKRPSFCASLKCGAKPRNKRCDWVKTQYLNDPRPEKCPGCGAPVDVVTTDSTDYAWFLWGPGRGGRWKRLETDR